MVLFILGIDENGRYTGSTSTWDLCKTMNNILSDLTNRSIIMKVGILELKLLSQNAPFYYLSVHNRFN